MQESRPSLQSARLIVRPFCAADASDLHEYLSNPQTYLYEPGEPITLSLAGLFAEDMATSPDFWAVEVAATGQVSAGDPLVVLSPAPQPAEAGL